MPIIHHPRADVVSLLRMLPPLEASSPPAITATMASTQIPRLINLRLREESTSFCTENAETSPGDDRVPIAPGSFAFRNRARNAPHTHA
ncbi:MAG: hypothetical protein FWD59_01425 [Micrococcales bacterium]|nr:hypothetical protein [Micrococcales bacterium]